MLIAFSKCKNERIFSMTDSMNFGPDWIRNLSSDGNTGGGTSTSRYQLADYRYGREEMLALFDRNIKPPTYLTNFKKLYSETTLPPLALLPASDEERSTWQTRPVNLGGPPRGRGGSLERGGRGGRGRTTYQPFSRTSNYEGWGNGEQSDWSPRKEYSARPVSMDNWRRSRNNEDDDAWRTSSGRGGHEKWGRSANWRGETDGEERSGPPERGARPNWHDNRGPLSRKSWDEDHLPEWATENPLESGGSFDDRGAFHGSDDEQADGFSSKNNAKKEGLQKSTSQQHISQKTHPPLFSSKSTISLVNKEIETDKDQEDNPPKKVEVPSKEHSLTDEETSDIVLEQVPKETNNSKEPVKTKDPPNISENHKSVQIENKVEDNELEKLQEDFVLKLVSAEEETLKQSQPHNSFDISNLPPPPNLSVPGQDKWYYQDPQGQMQGPFTNMEMTEWYKAGYFGQDLKVRRHCDERYYLLGDLMTLSSGGNPFQANVRFPILKHDISKMAETDMLQYQYLAQLASYKQTAPAGVISDTWGAHNIQQELTAQRLIMQQQTHQDLQYIQQPPATNPLMHMISQMQQANKLPQANMLDKRPPNIPSAIDPQMHLQMTNFLSLQNRLPGTLPNQLPAGIPGPLPPESIPVNLAGLPSAPIGATGIPISGIPIGLNSGLGMNVPRPTTVEHNTPIENNPIASLLKQLNQQKQNQVESLWPQNQFTSNNAPPPPHWSGPDPPLSMWDMQQNTTTPTQSTQSEQSQSEKSPKKQPEPLHVEKEKTKKAEKHKENKHKEDEKEQKKKKKADEEERLKKEAEEKEKRKQEQRKLEMERKAEADKKKKEEERIKKEIEKAKKEAEEKRQRELEEKRKLKEQRKQEEEARKKAEEMKKVEEERVQKEKEQREREERQRAEERRQEQISLTKSAPWSHANSSLGLSLAEIQKAEKEKKAQEALLAQKAQQEKELKMLQQQQLEKLGNLQLGWAKKPLEPRKVKSLAEIQAEEQERLSKEASEARLRKEKEAREVPQLPTTNSIWSGQTLTWASASSTNSQWSSTVNTSGFWEEPTPKQPPNKPSNVSKSSSMSTINNSSKQVSTQPKQQKTKTKKEEPQPASKKNNNNNNIDDDFTNWCYKALENISTDVDVPTFVTFLRDIESAFEVREYCKEYLGENNATQQFANSFLEKRRTFKSKESHKDDMCTPAPAITPIQHNMEFQEVKGKNKKSKKSKMLKVDSRILGFNVTSAPDRINVGDRDYGDNS